MDLNNPKSSINNHLPQDQAKALTLTRWADNPLAAGYEKKSSVIFLPQYSAENVTHKFMINLKSVLNTKQITPYEKNGIF